MRELISEIENDIYSNKYYYNKKHPDFETKSRLESILRKQKKKWKSETLKYIKRVHNMKELQKEKNDKENEMPHRSIEYRELKEAQRKQSFERLLKKENNDKKIYIKKLRKEESKREGIQNRLEKCK